LLQVAINLEMWQTANIYLIGNSPLEQCLRFFMDTLATLIASTSLCCICSVY